MGPRGRGGAEKGKRMTRAPLKDQTLGILRDRGVSVRTVLDVGIHTATPELIRAFPKARHVLFEPVAEFEERIRKSYQGIDHVLHMVAVGETSGSVTLRTVSVLAGQEISHSAMVADRAPEAQGERTVPMVSIDDAVAAHGYEGPFLLKIDIDGQELKVIRGAARTLPQCAIVIVECARGELAQRISAVQTAGFTLFDLTEPCYYDKAFWQCDAVFLRSDLHRVHFRQLEGKVEPGMYEMFR